MGKPETERAQTHEHTGQALHAGGLRATRLHSAGRADEALRRGKSKAHEAKKEVSEPMPKRETRGEGETNRGETCGIGEATSSRPDPNAGQLERDTSQGLLSAADVPAVQAFGAVRSVQELTQTTRQTEQNPRTNSVSTARQPATTKKSGPRIPGGSANVRLIETGHTLRAAHAHTSTREG